MSKNKCVLFFLSPFDKMLSIITKHQPPEKYADINRRAVEEFGRYPIEYYYDIHAHLNYDKGSYDAFFAATTEKERQAAAKKLFNYIIKLKGVKLYRNDNLIDPVYMLDDPFLYKLGNERAQRNLYNFPYGYHEKFRLYFQNIYKGGGGGDTLNPYELASSNEEKLADIDNKSIDAVLKDSKIIPKIEYFIPMSNQLSEQLTMYDVRKLEQYLLNNDTLMYKSYFKTNTDAERITFTQQTIRDALPHITITNEFKLVVSPLKDSRYDALNTDVFNYLRKYKLEDVQKFHAPININLSIYDKYFMANTDETRKYEIMEIFKNLKSDLNIMECDDEFIEHIREKTEDATDAFDRYRESGDLTEILNLTEKHFFARAYDNTKDAAAAFYRYQDTDDLTEILNLKEKQFFTHVYEQTKDAAAVFDRYRASNDLSEILNLKEKKFFTDVYNKIENAAAAFDHYRDTNDLSAIITPTTPLMSCDKNLLQFYMDVISIANKPPSVYKEYFDEINDPLKRPLNIAKILKCDEKVPETTATTTTTTQIAVGGAALVVGFACGMLIAKKK